MNGNRENWYFYVGSIVGVNVVWYVWNGVVRVLC